MGVSGRGLAASCPGVAGRMTGPSAHAGARRDGRRPRGRHARGDGAGGMPRGVGGGAGERAGEFLGGGADGATAGHKIGGHRPPAPDATRTTHPSETAPAPASRGAMPTRTFGCAPVSRSTSGASASAGRRSAGRRSGSARPSRRWSPRANGTLFPAPTCACARRPDGRHAAPAPRRCAGRLRRVSTSPRDRRHRPAPVESRAPASRAASTPDACPTRRSCAERVPVAAAAYTNRPRRSDPTSRLCDPPAVLDAVDFRPPDPRAALGLARAAAWARGTHAVRPARPEVAGSDGSSAAGTRRAFGAGVRLCARPGCLSNGVLDDQSDERQRTGAPPADELTPGFAHARVRHRRHVYLVLLARCAARVRSREFDTVADSQRSTNVLAASSCHKVANRPSSIT